MKMIRSLFVVLLLMAAGCAHSVHQVHTSDFAPKASLQQGQIVKGYGEQFAIMGVVRETNYVEKAYRDLMRNCPGGAITGITTQYSTSLGFLSWTNKALMQGLCVKSVN